MSMTPVRTDYVRRAESLNDVLSEPGVDLLLVGELNNLRYLTGYTGSNGLALVGPERRLFLTDFRYLEQSATEVDPSFERITTTTTMELFEAAAEAIGEQRLRLGFDDANISVATYERLGGLLGDGVELVPAAGLVERLRRVKDAEEIETIAAAQRLADEALEALLAAGIIGRTERELALDLEHGMRLRGASEPSFASIIAAGPHGALPHAQPRDVPVEAGQLVVIDWGARYRGYCSDCTRTVAAGAVSDHARSVYATVLEAQIAALDGVRAGADPHAVDAIARDRLTSAGYGENFGHGLGHGVGLEIHEAPTLSARIPKGSDQLHVDEVVTVEPGVYLPGDLGIRIEDLCVVTDAAPRVLTGIPKDLRVVA